MHVILTGKSAKGKQRVKQFGTRWRILAEPRRIQACPGIAMQIVAEGDDAWRSLRWVQVENDPDFVIDRE